MLRVLNVVNGVLTAARITEKYNDKKIHNQYLFIETVVDVTVPSVPTPIGIGCYGDNTLRDLSEQSVFNQIRTNGISSCSYYCFNQVSFVDLWV